MRRALAASVVSAVLASGCARDADRSGAAPIPRVAWAGVGVDVGRPGQGPGGGGGATISPQVGFAASGPEALVLMGCCLAWLAASEAVKASRGPDAIPLLGGAPVWEGMRAVASEEFVRALDEELLARVKVLDGPPPATPPAGADVLATAELGPATRTGDMRVQVSVRLRVRDRRGAPAFVEDVASAPFAEPPAWDDRAAEAFRAAVSPAVSRLISSYRISLRR